ncbi:hypothetical protein HGI80_06075, partial [Clostridium acetobutylicum]|nr:hypothetical protein [Clostridium acetobutylicum]
MANSIVFQNAASQLRSAIYGYDGTNYQPVKVNSTGELQINVGTINAVGTITRLGVLGTVNAVGTVTRLGVLGTVNRV